MLSRRSVALMRKHLSRGEMTPAMAQLALNEIPPRDRDRWLDLVWDIDELPDDGSELPRGCVPYLPCPVATVLEAVHHVSLASDDVFVDLGSGAGRTIFLAHLLTGASCIGIEIQPALIKEATGRAAWLNLSRTRFVQGDAVEVVRFIPMGTVFFLYCPFSGERVRRFLDALESVARTRPIRVCCVDMPRLDRPWLAAVPSSSVNLDVYRSTHFDGL